jgi:putative oxidoreductase
MHFFLPGLLEYADWALLALRLLIAVIFFASGWNHVRNPAGRAKSIGQSPTFTLLLGIAEIAGSLGVASGVWIQLAAMGLILVMLGAAYKKVFVWKTGFWGEKTFGWHYELMLIAMNLILVTLGGGRFVLA